MAGQEDYTMAGLEGYDGAEGFLRGWRVMTGLEGFDGAGGL